MKKKDRCVQKKDRGERWVRSGRKLRSGGGGQKIATGEREITGGGSAQCQKELPGGVREVKKKNGANRTEFKKNWGRSWAKKTLVGVCLCREKRGWWGASCNVKQKGGGAQVLLEREKERVKKCREGGKRENDARKKYLYVSLGRKTAV